MGWKPVSEVVFEVLAARVGVERSELTRERELLSLGADSLDAVEIVMDLEERLCLSIPDEDAERMQRVGDLIDYLEGRDGRGGAGVLSKVKPLPPTMPGGHAEPSG